MKSGDSKQSSSKPNKEADASVPTYARWLTAGPAAFGSREDRRRVVAAEAAALHIDFAKLVESGTALVLEFRLLRLQGADVAYLNSPPVEVRARAVTKPQWDSENPEIGWFVAEVLESVDTANPTWASVWPQKSVAAAVKKGDYIVMHSYLPSTERLFQQEGMAQALNRPWALWRGKPTVLTPIDPMYAFADDPAVELQLKLDRIVESVGHLELVEDVKKLHTGVKALEASTERAAKLISGYERDEQRLMDILLGASVAAIVATAIAFLSPR